MRGRLRRKKSRNKSGGKNLLRKVLSVLAGTVFVLLLLEAGIRFGSILHRKFLELTGGRGGADYTILCLGDSMTYGQYPGFLKKQLSKKFPELSFYVIDRGRAATNTAYILDNVSGFLTEFNPDAVILMGGINDARGDLAYGGLKIGRLSSLRVIRLLRLVIYHLSNGFFSPDEAQAAEGAGVCIEKIDIMLEEIELGRGIAGVVEELEELSEEYPDCALPHKFIGGLMAGRDTLRAERALRKALELSPEQPDLYTDLAYVYMKEADNLAREGEDPYPFREKARRILIENFEKVMHIQETGGMLLKLKEYDAAEKALKKQLERTPENRELKRRLALLRFEAGERSIDELYGIGGYEPKRETILNFIGIHERISLFGAKTVISSYPNRPVAPIRESFPYAPEVIFVSNFETFREAVARKGYREYFIDSFAGDFGHCTRRGNRLLASNILKALAPEIRAAFPGPPSGSE